MKKVPGHPELQSGLCHHFLRYKVIRTYMSRRKAVVLGRSSPRLQSRAAPHATGERLPN